MDAQTMEEWGGVKYIFSQIKLIELLSYTNNIAIWMPLTRGEG